MNLITPLLSRVAALLLLLTALNRAAADPLDEKLAGLVGSSLLQSDKLEEFKLIGPGGKLEVVDLVGAPFLRAASVSTLVRPETRWGLQLQANTVGAVKKGDALFASFWARALQAPLAPGEAQTQLIFEQNGSPYTKSVKFPVALSSKWQRFYVPFEAALDLEPGKAHLCFLAGFDPQTIEIAGVALVNYQTAVKVSELPWMPISYRGREADAEWRSAAAERIEKLRKAELRVLVLDPARKPIAGAKVFVSMKRHAYGFGTAVNARLLLEQSADADKYREVLVENFNKVTIENHLKWPEWERDRTPAIRAIDWLHEHNLPVRGHVLVWPGSKNLPSRIRDLFPMPEALRPAILLHIADELDALRGQCVEWDVMNEPFDNNAVQSVLAGRSATDPRIAPEAGAAFIAEWFKAARRADPQAKLDINDYSILSTGGTDLPHQEYYERTIDALISQGAPVQGIGMQGHFGEDLTPIPRLFEILDRFSKFGLPIQTTEHDINTSDEQLQADYTRDFMTAFFSHPATSGIIVWGFWAKSHWIPNAAYYRADWSLRPAGQVWRDLVFKKWWTQANGTTDQSGAFAIRGFLGEYEIKVIADGVEQSVPASLVKAGTRLEIIVAR